jgi:hypothetical protein
MQNTQNTSIENLAAIGHEIDESGLTFVSGGKPKVDKVYVKASCETKDNNCKVEAGIEFKF